MQSTVEKEDLDFQFDEELDMPAVGRTNNFTENFSDDESDYELSDRDINKILIVTQVRHRAPKHDGHNRTGDFTSRTKISQDLEQVINDGLHNYEEDLWTHDVNHTSNSYKTLNIITQEDFKKMAPKSNKKPNPDVPPPPPTYDSHNDSRLNQSTGSGLGSKKARFFAVNKEEFIDPRTPRKRKTRHLRNPPVESHVGWVSVFFFFFFSDMYSALKFNIQSFRRLWIRSNIDREHRALVVQPVHRQLLALVHLCHKVYQCSNIHRTPY